MPTTAPAPEPAHAPSDEEETTLWQRWRAGGDAQARHALITRYLPYARIVAATYYARRIHDEIEFAEYQQLASLAIVEAVDRFDPAVGVQFKTFASRRIHGSILNGLEQLTEKQRQIAVRQRLQRERLQAAKEAAKEAAMEAAEAATHASRTGSAGAASAAGPDADAQRHGPELFAYLAQVGIGMALGILLEGTGMLDHDAIGVGSEPDAPYRQVHLNQLRRRVSALVGQLPPPQQRVLREHYVHDRPFEEVARRLGLSRGRISQIHRQALDALRQALAHHEPCDLSC